MAFINGIVRTDSNLNVFGLKAETGRWIFVAVGFIINICLGTVYSYSIFKTPLQQLLSIGSTQGNLPFIFVMVVAASGATITGKLLLKHDPKIICTIGGLLVGLGYILSGLLPRIMPNIWTLVLTYSLINGLGVAFAYGVPIAVVNRWFPDKRGLAIGITLAGFGGSPFVTANIATPMIANSGPLATFLLLGAVFLVIVAVLSQFMSFPPEGWQPYSKSVNTQVKDTSVNFTKKQMVKTASFKGLFLTYTIGSLVGLLAIGIASPVGVELAHLDVLTAGTLVGVFALFNAGGRTVFGWLTDKITPRWTAVISLSLMVVVSLLMVLIPTTVSLYVICFCVFWLCYGGWLALAPVSTTIYFGPKYYTENYGILFLGNGLGCVLGNLISGQSKDIFGNYTIAFIITAGLALIGVILSFIMLKPPRTRPQV